MDTPDHSAGRVKPAATATKAALRAALGTARARRSGDQLLAAGAALAGWVDALKLPPVVAAYLGVGTEPPTTPLLALLEARGVRILLPVVLPGGMLDWSDAPVASARPAGPLGLLEPVGSLLGIDAVRGAGLVLVPALAVDRAGVRLGRGGGYYDRALAGRARTSSVLAVVFDDEVLDVVPAEAHDQRVGGALTPSGLVMFDA